MASIRPFVDELEEYVHQRLSNLDLLKEPEIGAADRSEIVRRLKMALKNELEASEIAAIWIPSTPEIDVKLALARQVGDEAKHYRLIEEHLTLMGADLSAFNPTADGYGPMFQLLAGFKTTVERIGAAQFTRESLALKKNEQFIEFCEAAGDHATANLYRENIQPDEDWHVRLGRTVLEKYARTPDLQAQARKAVEAVLDLAVKIQNKQLKEMKVSHAPGC
ncbi:MAG TPA: ferritin-like domain-containing protein [Terriglobia bacterium]|nr:ferritin-like domain-containing protein [Terriglobia bacterium]